MLEIIDEIDCHLILYTNVDKMINKDLLELQKFIHKHMYDTYNTQHIKKPRKIDPEQLPLGGTPYKYEVNRGLTR